MTHETGPARASRDLLPRFALIALVLLSLAVPVYVLLPLPDLLHDALYNVVAGGAVVVAFLGLRRNKPQRRTGWLLVLLGFTGWLIGDLVWALEQILIPDRYPAPSDAVYLSAYGLLGAGTLCFIRTRRGGRDLPALLDASIITTGAGVLVAVFLIAPLADDSSLTLAGRVVTSAYPLGDLFLLGVIARMYAAPGARTLSYRLLATALGLTLLTDLAWNVASVVTGESVSSAVIDAGWLGGYIVVAGAACVPSMLTLAEPGPDKVESAPSRRRLALLAGGLMLPGAALLVNGLTGQPILWPVIGLGMLALSGLVVARMIGLLRTVQVQAVRLSALARSDALTGAPNRRTWDHELSRACAFSRETGATLTVAILDLDHFKRYNDTLGHQAGDRLLREAVAAWTDALPPGALLARYGGEEFAVLLPETSPREAAQVLNGLRGLTPNGQTFSAGLAAWNPLTDPGAALAAADEALYAAKRAGRNRVVVHGDDPLAALSEPLLPRFTIVTQPIVDLSTSTVTSNEALARFTGPGNADVEAVFRRAHAAGHGDLLELATLRAALEMPGRPSGQALHVNASARAITSERFMAGLPSRLVDVVIELNEDPGQIDPGVVAAAIAELRARGARIGLDDVGAGAAEFARLATLRPDVIKVDRSLVDGCSTDPGRTAVLRALVAYAAYLHVEVCGEGVEDAADLRHLAKLGITHAQGYLLARPGPGWPQPIPLELAAAAVA